MIRLAAALPKGSPERRAILKQAYSYHSLSLSASTGSADVRVQEKAGLIEYVTVVSGIKAAVRLRPLKNYTEWQVVTSTSGLADVIAEGSMKGPAHYQMAIAAATKAVKEQYREMVDRCYQFVGVLTTCEKEQLKALADAASVTSDRRRRFKFD
jgi:hypothetical protein